MLNIFIDKYIHTTRVECSLTWKKNKKRQSGRWDEERSGGVQPLGEEWGRMGNDWMGFDDRHGLAYLFFFFCFFSSFFQSPLFLFLFPTPPSVPSPFLTRAQHSSRVRVQQKFTTLYWKMSYVMFAALTPKSKYTRRACWNIITFLAKAGSDRSSVRGIQVGVGGGRIDGLNS